MRILYKKNGGTALNLLAAVRLLLNKFLILLCCGLFCGCLVYFSTLQFVKPQYKASVRMYVNNKAAGVDTNGNTLSIGDLNAAAQLAETYSVIVKDVSILQDIQKKADVDISVKQLEKSISVSSVNNTEVLQISVIVDEPKLATLLVNSAAEVIPDRIANIVEGSSIKVISFANIPESAVSPDYLKLTLIGIAIGFMGSAAIICCLNIFDTKIKSRVELEQWQYPVLGTIPDFAMIKHSGQHSYGYGSKERR